MTPTEELEESTATYNVVKKWYRVFAYGRHQPFENDRTGGTALKQTGD